MWGLGKSEPLVDKPNRDWKIISNESIKHAWWQRLYLGPLEVYGLDKRRLGKGNAAHPENFVGQANLM
ncbi:hypothetical protein E2P81_ATG01993 [Venturia nashicola]|uniref:Uncharacterized protein n=1 Tax=Venturia nashicola TaxID=86259 RepID=A0A4Z1PI29_9PEZI|nr:hypothetical protein E6O75_ATG02034 [Venturia nashicola]TLD35690.1 hypothetical protein E2P81_ATG01993 [Venturia nashicola]